MFGFKKMYMSRYSLIYLLWFLICSSYTLALEALPDKLELDQHGSVVYRVDVPLTKQLTTVQTKTRPVYFGLMGAPIRREAELKRYQPLKTNEGTYYVSSILMPVADADSPTLIIKNKLGYLIHDSSGRVVKKDIPEKKIDKVFQGIVKPAKL